MSTATELLRRALEAYDHKEEPYFERLHHAFEDIRAFLAAEPEADKPVAWITPDGEGFRMRFEPPVNDVPLGWTPLYTRPEPARKPMSDVEIADIYYSGTDIPEGHLFAFAEGFRQAERHHNIK